MQTSLPLVSSSLSLWSLFALRHLDKIPPKSSAQILHNADSFDSKNHPYPYVRDKRDISHNSFWCAPTFLHWVAHSSRPVCLVSPAPLLLECLRLKKSLVLEKNQGLLDIWLLLNILVSSRNPVQYRRVPSVHAVRYRRFLTSRYRHSKSHSHRDNVRRRAQRWTNQSCRRNSAHTRCSGQWCCSLLIWVWLSIEHSAARVHCALVRHSNLWWLVVGVWELGLWGFCSCGISELLYFFRWYFSFPLSYLTLLFRFSLFWAIYLRIPFLLQVEHFPHVLMLSRLQSGDCGAWFPCPMRSPLCAPVLFLVRLPIGVLDSQQRRFPNPSSRELWHFAPPLPYLSRKSYRHCLGHLVRPCLHRGILINSSGVWILRPVLRSVCSPFVSLLFRRSFPTSILVDFVGKWLA